jgi:hypothetical protein
MRSLTRRANFRSKIITEESLEAPLEAMNGGDAFQEKFKLGKIKYRTSGVVNVVKVFSMEEKEEKVAKIYR